MKYQITVYEAENNIILEQIAIKKNKIVKRRESDNPKEIKLYIKELMASPKEIKTVHEKKDNIEIIFKEDLNFMICNYSRLKNSSVLDDVRRCLREYQMLEKKKKKRRAYAKVFALSVGAVIALTSLQKKNEEKEENIKIEIENDEELNNNITILNTNLETVYQEPPQTEFRSQHYIEVMENRQNLANLFPEIGSKKNDERKQNVELAYSTLTEKYANITGIDQELIECILAQERGFHSSIKDAGGAIGVAQIQVGAHIGEKLYLKNVQTGIIESFTVTENLIKNLEGNIKVCATLLQNKLEYYDGNTLIAIQAYNYGYGAMDKVLEQTAKENGKTKNQITCDPSNITWMSYAKEYKNGKYGDNQYLEHVLDFVSEENFTVQYNNLEPNIVMSVKPDILLVEKSHGL